MEILDGNEECLLVAAAMVIGNPNPAHLLEDRVMIGRERGVEEMLDESLAASAVAAYSIHGGEAMIGGVTLEPAMGVLKHQIWMLTTADAISCPRWLLREGKRLLEAADRFFKWPYGYVQAIPGNYPQGLNYARHLGFREVGREMNIVIMERMIPRWVQ